MKRYSLDEWLIDFPGQTAEFERLTQMLKDYPDDGPTIRQIKALGKRDGEAVKMFLTWQVVQDAIAEGYLRRVEPWDQDCQEASLPKSDWE